MVYTEQIVNRLNNPNLHDPENDGYKIIDGTIGEYLENYDNHLMDLFITRATGGYLDLHAGLYGLVRHDGEDDSGLRSRVLTDISILQRTSDFTGLDVVLWVFFTGLVDDKNVLSSRNPYLKNEHDTGYVFIGTGVDSDYLQGKFILNDILWI